MASRKFKSTCVAHIKPLRGTALEQPIPEHEAHSERPASRAVHSLDPSESQDVSAEGDL